MRLQSVSPPQLFENKRKKKKQIKTFLKNIIFGENVGDFLMDL